MARLHHLTLVSVVFFLLLTGLLAAGLPGVKKVGRKVTMTVQYPPAGSGEKITILTHLVGEGGVGESHFYLDSDDYEPMAAAVEYLVSTLEKMPADSQASRAEL